MFSGSDASANSSRSILNTILNSERTPLLFKNDNAKQVKNPNKLPTLQDVYTEYKKLDDVIKHLLLTSSYRRMTFGDLFYCIAFNIEGVVCSAGMITGLVFAIHFMDKKGRFHAARKYKKIMIPGTEEACHDLYPISNYYSADDDLPDHETFGLYCYEKYDDLWWMSFLFYGLAVASSLFVVVSICVFVCVAGEVINNFNEKLDLTTDKVRMRHLKSQFKAELNAMCKKYSVHCDQDQEPIPFVRAIELQLPFRRPFLKLVEQTKNSKSFFARLPADITLLIAAYANLTDLTTREKVITHFLFNSCDSQSANPHFSSAFYAPKETAATFDARISAAAAAARAPAPASSRVSGVSACVSDAIVEPELYEGLRSGR